MELHNAIRKGDATLVEKLLDQKVNVNFKHHIWVKDLYEELTPLQIAVAVNNAEIVDLLLKHNADIRVVDESNRDLLHLALWCGVDKAIIERLISAGLKFTHDLIQFVYEGDVDSLAKKSRELVDIGVNILPDYSVTNSLSLIGFACLAGQLKAAQCLVEKLGLDTLEGENALICAARHGHLAVVEWLVAQRVSFTDIAGKNALVSAARNGHLAVVQYLVDNKMVSLAEAGEWALERAAAEGQLEVVKYLINQDVAFAAAGKWALQEAAEKGQLAAVEYLANKMGLLAEDGEWALGRAAAEGHLAVVEYLANKMAPLAEAGKLALVEAAAEGHLAVVEYLANKMGLLAEDGEWALVEAAAEGHLAVVEYLANKMAPLAEAGKLALVKAAAEGQLAVVEYLVNHGVSLSAVGDVALEQAAAKGQLVVIEYLVNKGLSLEGWKAKWWNGRSDRVLKCAAEHGQLAVVNWLKDKGIATPVEIKETTLFGAAKHGVVSTVKTLINTNFAVNSKDKDGMTVLAYAVQNFSNLELVKWLIQKGADIQAKNNQSKTVEDLADPSIKKWLTGRALVYCAKKQQLAQFITLHTTSAINLAARDEYNYTALMYAAENNDQVLLDYLLDDLHNAGVGINFKNDEGKTALHIAAAKGHTAVVERLIAYNAYLNVRDKNDCTPLLSAAESDQTDSIRILLDQGARLRVANREGNTAIHIAALRGNVRLLELLLRQAKLIDLPNLNGKTPLHIALEQIDKLPATDKSLHHYKMLVEYLLQNVADISLTVNGLSPLDIIQQEAFTKSSKKQEIGVLLLKHAETVAQANQNNIKATFELARYHAKHNYLQMLFEFKSRLHTWFEQPDPNFPPNLAKLVNNQNHITWLHVAAWYGDVDFVKKLHLPPAGNLAGLSLDIQTIDGNTPLHYAAARGHFEVVDYLVKQNVNILLKNNAWDTALHSAAWYGELEVLKLLLAKSFNVSASQKGWTLLHCAIEQGHYELAKYLLDTRNSSIEINAKIPATEQTALHLATMHGDEKLVELLLSRKADTEIKDQAGWTALHIASSKGYIAIVDQLIAQINDLNQQNSQGQTVLHLALEGGHLHVAEKLLAAGIDINLVNNAGERAVDIAEKNQHRLIVKKLRKLHLFIAAQQGDIKEIKQLQAKKVDLTIKNSQQFSPILLAAMAHQIETVKFLHDNGAVISQALDAEGNTVLHLIAKQGYLNPELSELIDLCLKGISIDAVNRQRETPLYLAVKQSDSKVDNSHFVAFIQHLLIKGAKVSISSDQSLLNPLQLAVIQGNNQLVELFLKQAAVDKNVNHPQIGNLLHLAIYYNQLATVRFLLTQYNFDPSLPNEEGLTPLSLAASLGHTEIIYTLVESCKTNNQVDPNLTDSQGRTPLYWAIVKKQIEAIEQLYWIKTNFNPAPLPQCILPNGHVLEWCTPITLAAKLQQLYPEQKKVYQAVLNTIYNYAQNDPQQIDYKISPIRNLVFQGGGVKGLAYVGALKALEEDFAKKGTNFTKEITHVAGTSAGAITALLVALGYSADEIEQALQKDFTTFLDVHNGVQDGNQLLENLKAINIEKPKTLSDWPSFLWQLYTIKKQWDFLNDNKYKGFCSGNEFRRWIEMLIYEKTQKNYLTLGEFNQLIKAGTSGFKHLKVIGIWINTPGGEGQPMVFSSEDPSMQDYIISDLIRISMSLPFIFEPHHVYRKNIHGERIKESERLYVDGGLLKNLPIEVFDEITLDRQGNPTGKIFNRQTLGFGLVSPDQLDPNIKKKLYGGDFNELLQVKDISQFAAKLISIYVNSEQSLAKTPGDEQRVIYISNCNIETTKFNIDVQEKKQLFTSGKDALNKFLINRNSPYQIVPGRVDYHDQNNYDANAVKSAGAAGFSAIEMPHDTRPLFQEALPYEIGIGKSKDTRYPVSINDQFLNNDLSEEKMDKSSNSTQAILEILRKNFSNTSDINPSVTQLYDTGEWDVEPVKHPQTQEPIFTFRVYKNEQEVGSAKFYKHPLLCRNVEANQHNLMEVNGVLNQLSVDPNLKLDWIQEICEALPPNLTEQLKSRALQSAQHGILRGTTNLIGYTLNRKGFSANVANKVSQVLYYGSYFTLQYANRLTTNSEQLNPTTYLTAANQALWDTGALLATNLTSSLMCQTGNTLEQKGWHKMGTFFKSVGQYGGTAKYLLDGSLQQGVLPTITGLVSGTGTELAINYVGQKIVNTVT